MHWLIWRESSCDGPSNCEKKPCEYKLSHHCLRWNNPRTKLSIPEQNPTPEQFRGWDFNPRMFCCWGVYSTPLIIQTFEFILAAYLMGKWGIIRLSRAGKTEDRFRSTAWGLVGFVFDERSRGHYRNRPKLPQCYTSTRFPDKLSQILLTKSSEASSNNFMHCIWYKTLLNSLVHLQSTCSK